MSRTLYIISLLSCLLFSSGLFASTIDTVSLSIEINRVKKLEALDPDKSYSEGRELLRQSEALHYELGVIELSHLLGRLAYTKAQTDSAIMFFQKGIQACKQPNNRHHLSVLYNNIGVTNHLQADYKGAATHYQQALQYAKKYPPKTMPIERIYNNYGAVFLRLGLYDEAINHLQKALQINKSDDTTGVAIGALQSLGSVYSHLKKDSLAIAYFDSAYHLSIKSGKTQNLSILLNNMAELQLKQGQYNTALSNLLKAADAVKKGVISISYLHTIYANIGTTYLRLGNLDKAEQYLLSAYHSERLIPSGKKDVIGQLSELYEAKKDYKKAFIYNKLYYELQDSLQGQKIAIQVSELEKKYQTIEKDKEIISAQLMIAEKNNLLAKKDIWILVIAFVGILLLSSIVTMVIWKNKKNKNQQAIAQLKSLIAGEEKERNRLSKDLHDGVNSTLNAIKIYLAATSNQDLQHLDKSTIIEELNTMLDIASDDVRTVAFNLTPHALTLNGLGKSITYYCQRALEKTAIQATIQIYDGIDELAPDLSLNIYRIVQELTQNIVKHSKATNMTVLLYKNEEKIVLLVEDNGIGINESKLKITHAQGLGLTSVSERVQAHKGNITMEPQNEQNGLVVCIEFPVI